ncbi:sigma 54-interacting transcriptional regulator [Shinella pollutisoli]|uniref:HTH-type transcriptional regulatory protein TyrR n=1 Tax=Shinella pollutisoli TaxID=2250594 RepID=A0ABV7DND9_9HYPH
MKRTQIAPFRLDPNPNSIDPVALIGLCQEEGFRQFLDVLNEAVIVFDGEGRIVALNKAAEKSTGVHRSVACGVSAEIVSARSRIDLKPLVAGFSVGHRSLLLRAREEPGDIRVSLYALAQAGAPAARLALFHPPAAAVAARPKTGEQRPLLRSDVLPLYQSRLEPLIEFGVRAFQARRRILLLGETGVGKTTLVMQMHRQAAGLDRPFVHVNCSSISESLFEAEMFGYERGAFTGALASGKPGFIEAANGGTLFLDEIGDMPRSQQAKLLKFLEDGCIQPVGGVRQKAVDVFVVCATNRDLAEDVRERCFREDLYYRIAMIPLTVPPLREYRDELPGLIDTLIANLNLTRKRRLTLSEDCRRRMIEHSYPGNMRELLGIIGRLDLLADEVAGVEHLPPQMLSPPANAPVGAQDLPDEDGWDGTEDRPLKERVKAYEKRLIDAALKAAPSKRQAARALGIDIASLLRKLQE